MIISKFISYFNESPSIWKTRSNLLILILFLFCFVAADANAGLWDELPKQAQNKVLEELEAGLPEGSAREYSKLVRENFREWSKHAGEISAGEYHNAISAVANESAAYMSDKIGENLPPGAKKWYDLAATYPDTVVRIGQSMLDPKKSWGDVGNIVWDKAITELESNLAGKPKAVVISTINEFFGTRSIAGYTPGEAYFALLDVWIQFVRKTEKEWENSCIDDAYQFYRERRAENISIDSIKEEILPTKRWIPRYSPVAVPYEYCFRNLKFTYGEAVEKFAEAEAENAYEFSSWLKQSTDRFNNVFNKAKNNEKTKLHQALNKIRDQLIGNPTNHFALIRSKLNRLIEKHLNKEDKEKLEQAKARASLTLGVYKNANSRLQNACKRFDEAEKRANSLYDQAKGLIRDSEKSGDHVNIIKEVDKLNEDTQKTIDKFNEFKQLEKSLENSFSSIKSASQKTCTESDNVDQANTKKEAFKALEAAIAAARVVRFSHSKGSLEIENAKRKIGPLVKALLELKKSQDFKKINKIKDSLKTLQQILSRMNSHEAMISDYEAARNSMQEALATAKTNSVPMVRMKKEIEELLSGVKQYPSAASILFELKNEAIKADCINKIDSQSIKRKFPDKPKISDALLQQNQTLFESAKNLNNLEMSNDKIITIAKKEKELEQTLNKMDSMKFAADICVTNALIKYKEKWIKTTSNESTEKPVVEPSESPDQCTCSGGSMEIGPYKESDCLKDQKIWPGDLVTWSKKNEGTCYICPAENVQCKKPENKKYFVFKRSGAGYHPKWSGFADKVNGYDYFFAHLLPSEVDNFLKEKSQFKCHKVPEPVVNPVLFPTVWQPGTGKIEVVGEFETAKEIEPYRCDVPPWVPRDIPSLICNKWKFHSDKKYWGNIRSICGGSKDPDTLQGDDKPEPVIKPTRDKPDPSNPDSINPNNPTVSGLISTWVSSAEPPINATQGANTRYEPWGRFVGRTPSGVIRATHKPDDVGGKTSPEYLWSKRNQLDSVDHCTLSEYVIANLKGDSMAHCKNRYKPIVPKLIGMTSKEAQRRITALKLNPKVSIGSPAPSASLASTIERQGIKQGTSLSRGNLVPVWIFGPYIKPISVPKLLGKSASEAKTILISLGLKTKIEKGDAASSSELSGKVQSQHPVAGTATKKGGLVSISIYKPFIAPLIPDVINNTVSVARYRLKLAGYQVSRITIGDPAPTEKLSRKVQRQIPKGGSSAKPGDRVKLIIYSKFKKAVEKPIPKPEPEKIKMLVRQAPIIIKNSYFKHYKPAPGKLKGYQVEEAFISPQKTYWRYVTDHGGAEKTVNLTAHFKFDLPPREIKPGSNIQLNASGTLKGHSYGMYLGATLSYYADSNYGVNFRDGSITLRNGDLPLQKQNSAAVISNAKHGGKISKKIAAKLNVSPSASDSFSIIVTGTRGVKIKWPYKLEKVLSRKPNSAEPGAKSKIPKVTGSTVSVAKKILKLHGFRVSKISTGDAAPFEKLSRRVQRQIPTENSQAKSGTKVDLIIYSEYKKTDDKPPQSEPIPPVKKRLHPCGVSSVPVDATWTFYAQFWGGGNTVSFEKAGVICNVSGFTSFSGGVFSDYTCDKWINCNRTDKPESPITKIEKRDDHTVYYYKKGKSWGVRKPKTNTAPASLPPTKKSTEKKPYVGSWHGKGKTLFEFDGKKTYWHLNINLTVNKNGSVTGVLSSDSNKNTLAVTGAVKGSHLLVSGKQTEKNGDGSVSSIEITLNGTLQKNNILQGTLTYTMPDPICIAESIGKAIGRGIASTLVPGRDEEEQDAPCKTKSFSGVWSTEKI